MRQASDGSWYRQDETGKWHKVDAPQTQQEAVQIGVADQTPGQDARGYLRDLAQGALLGWSDEFDAGVGAGVGKLKSLFTGEDYDLKQNYETYRDNIRQNMATHQAANPISSTGVQLAGAVGTGIATAPKLVANTIPRLMALGAAEGAVAGAGESEGEGELLRDTLKGSVIGAGIGAAAKPVTHAVGRVAQSPLVAGPLNSILPEGRRIPVAGAVERSVADVPDAYKDAVKTADRLGFKLTPAQRTQELSTGQLEAAMKSRSGSAEPFDELADHNQRLLNRKVAQTLGQNSDQVDLVEAAKTNDLLWEAAEDLGESVPISMETFNRSRGAIGEYISKLGKTDKTPKLLEDIEGLLANKSALSAKEIQGLQSRLRKDAKAAYKSDYELAEVYDSIRSDLLSAIDNAAPESSELLKRARTLYRNRMPLEKPNVVNVATGDVKFGPLHTNYRRDVHGYVRGKSNSDAYDIAKLFDAFGRDVVGNSGTAERSRGLVDHLMWSKPRELAARAYLNADAYQRGSQLLAPSTLPMQKPMGAAITGGTQLLSDEDIDEMYRR